MRGAIIILCFLLSAVLAGNACAGEVHEAAKSGNIARLRDLLDKDPGLLYVQDEQGKTPLHWATGRGQIEAMKVLLDEYHVDVNVRNKNGGTPLHVAASQAKPEGVRLLLQHNADINARTKDNATPLHFAAFKLREGHLQAARILLENKADVNAKMNNGATPLLLAIYNNNLPMQALLRQYGASEPQGMSRTIRKGLRGGGVSDSGY